MRRGGASPQRSWRRADGQASGVHIRRAAGRARVECEPPDEAGAPPLHTRAAGRVRCLRRAERAAGTPPSRGGRRGTVVPLAAVRRGGPGALARRLVHRRGGVQLRPRRQPLVRRHVRGGHPQHRSVAPGGGAAGGRGRRRGLQHLRRTSPRDALIRVRLLRFQRPCHSDQPPGVAGHAGGVRGHRLPPRGRGAARLLRHGPGADHLAPRVRGVPVPRDRLHPGDGSRTREGVLGERPPVPLHVGRHLSVGPPRDRAAPGRGRSVPTCW